MKKINLLQLGTICILLLSSCTAYQLKKANKEFGNLQYSQAINDYNKVLKKSDNHLARINLANSYRLINDIAKAEPVYAEIVSYPESEPINMFYYAKMLMSEGNYAQAKLWLSLIHI